MRSIALAAGVAMLMLWCDASYAAPTDEVRALLDQGRSAEAYALARRHPEELGKADFDFYFGIAAIDSGNAGEGVLALERYIVQFPANDRARLELARGYFVLGELVRAREEFDAVSKRNPPPQVQATIERFKDSIRAQETRYTTTAGAYAELGGGWDSNVNSGVGSPIITVPTLGTVQLAQGGVKSGSSFLHAGAGGQVSHPIAPGVALIGGGSFEGKLHSDKFDSQFDQRSLAAYGGATYLKDKDLYRATLSVSQLAVDNRRFRDTVALGAEWHRQFDEFNTGSVFAQYARLEYPASPVRDADFYGFGVGWRRAFVGRIQPVFQVQALLGQEKNDFAPVRNDLTRDVATLRGSIAITPAPKWGASAGITYTNSRFKAPDPLFAATRGDHYYGVELGGSYRVAKDLTLRADYLYSNNDSNIALYEYKRHAITLRARYEF